MNINNSDKELTSEDIYHINMPHICWFNLLKYGALLALCVLCSYYVMLFLFWTVCCTKKDFKDLSWWKL